jgi:hypothetical protein
MYFLIIFFSYFCSAKKKETPAININNKADIFQRISQNISEKFNICILKIFTKV